MYYILFYKTAPCYLDRRSDYREEHLSLAQEAFNRGELIIAGTLGNPAKDAVIVFKGDSPEAAEKFAHCDPYVKNGLISEWEVKQWNIAIGELT